MLRTRLILHLIPLLVVLLAVGWLAYHLLSSFARRVDDYVEVHYQGILAAQKMNRSLARMETTMSRLETSGDSNEDVERLAAAWADVEQALNELRTVTRDHNQRLTENLFQASDALRHGVASFIHAERPGSAFSTARNPLDAEVTAVDRLLGQLEAANRDALRESTQRIRSITARTHAWLAAGLILAVLVSGWLALRLAHSLITPIQVLTEATEDVGRGNLERTVPVLSHDELGALAQAFNRMSSQLQVYREGMDERILRLNAMIRTTLATFPDPVFVVNPSGAPNLVNPAGQRLLDELQIEERLPDPVSNLVREAVASEEDFKPQTFDQVLTWELEGKRHDYLPRIMVMRDAQQHLSGLAVVLNEVTRFRLLDELKSDLLGTVSHQVKTPMTSVRMVLHLLMEERVGPLTEKQRELIQTACSDTERLLETLHVLLDVRRFERGHGLMNMRPVSPAELISEVEAKYLKSGLLKEHALRCAADEGLPEVSADLMRIQQVFSNLIENAVKHSPFGATVDVRATTGANGGVRFAVSDAGPGVPETLRQRIFEKFFRCPGESVSGSGLGLAIAKEIVEAHGGSIGVEPAESVGSVFFFELPAIGPD
jgi:signal transduction histidine kinase/HAMP domain-containing protein